MLNSSILTHKTLILLQLEDLADASDAARRELIVVFTHAVRGLREHQVPAFAAVGAKVPAVRSLVMLRRRYGRIKLRFSRTVNSQ